MKKISALIILLLQVAIACPQGKKILTKGDNQLHFQTFGSGKPLLIINGGPGMGSEGFVDLAKQLSQHNRTIIYDQRGTGLSKIENINPSTITMDLMIEDIETLRTHLEIEEWIVLGHSFGGMLAYFYASKYPERVRAMIQSSSGGMDLSLLGTLDITRNLTTIERDSLRYYNNMIANGDSSYETLLKRGTFLAPAYVFHRANIPVVADRLTQGNRTINSLVWQDLRSIDFNTKEILKHFKKPVLIIHGKEDVLGLKIPSASHGILPNSLLVVLEKTRHYGWLDCPQIYFEKIQEFLAKVD